jgi:hypothetical protein
MKFAPLVVSAVVSLFAISSATAQVASYQGGTISFDYTEFPVGLYAGSFLSDGVVENLQSFPPDGTGASYGFTVQVPGRQELLIVGGYRNPNNTGDIAFVFLNVPNTIAPGVRFVDPVSYSALFGFVDDVSGFQPPVDPFHTDLDGWIETIIAGHKFLSISGSVTISSIDADGVTGTFSGLMARTTGAMLVSAANGSFAVGSAPLSVSPETWAEIKSKFVGAPQP